MLAIVYMWHSSGKTYEMSGFYSGKNVNCGLLGCDGI